MYHGKLQAFDAKPAKLFSLSSNGAESKLEGFRLKLNVFLGIPFVPGRSSIVEYYKGMLCRGT